jgi:hypothetical protein
MRNVLKLLGIITIALVIGFSMISCEVQPTLPPGATIQVTNSSDYSQDAYVRMSLYQGTSLIAGPTVIVRNQTWQVTDCPTNTTLIIQVQEYSSGSGVTRSSNPFTLSGGQTRSFYYTGLSIY